MSCINFAANFPHGNETWSSTSCSAGAMGRAMTIAYREQEKNRQESKSMLQRTQSLAVDTKPPFFLAVGVGKSNHEQESGVFNSQSYF